MAYKENNYDLWMQEKPTLVLYAGWPEKASVNGWHFY